jgi:hypothetical protein
MITYLNYSLNDSYKLVLKKRNFISPNPSFISQLMNYEKELNGVITLKWDDIDTHITNILDWLKENAHEDFGNPNIFQWETIKEIKFHVPYWRRVKKI